MTVVSADSSSQSVNVTHHFLSFSIFVAFVLEAFFVEYSVDKSDLQTSLEKKIEELELAVAQYVTVRLKSQLSEPP